ncbi:MAG: PQQ-binding-like beta-propeller repeat protein [Vulcanimicrobiota bacterium]
MRISTLHAAQARSRPRPCQPDSSWRGQIEDWVSLSPRSDGHGNLLVTDAHSRLSAVDESTGNIVWTRAGAVAQEQPIVLPHGPLLGQVDDHLRATDPQTGELKWSLLMGEKISGPFLGPEGEILLMDRLDRPPYYSLRRLDPETGKTVWSQGLERLRAPIEIHDGRVFAASNTVPPGQTVMSALDLATGQPLFEFRDQQIDRIAFRQDKMLFFAITRLPREDVFELQQRNAANGEIDWRYSPQGAVRSHPAWSPDGSRVVFFEAVNGTLTTRLMGLDAASGEVAWSVAGGLGRHLTFGVDGSLYCSQTDFDSQGNSRAMLKRIDPTSGQVLWSHQAPTPPRWFQPTDAGDLVTVSDESGPDGEMISRLRVVDGQTGEQLWERTATGLVTDLELGGAETLFALEAPCRLVALDTRTGQLKSEMHHHESLALGRDQQRLFVISHSGTIQTIDGLGAEPQANAVGSLHSSRTWELVRPTVESTVAVEGKERPATSLDWNLNGRYDAGVDALLLSRNADGQWQPLDGQALAALDADGNRQLDAAEATHLWLWADSNRNGLVEATDRLHPLADGRAFDKLKLDLDAAEIMLAANSQCPEEGAAASRPSPSAAVGPR